jgi:hypothetical protein
MARQADQFVPRKQKAKGNELAKAAASHVQTHWVNAHTVGDFCGKAASGGAVCTISASICISATALSPAEC